jgi:hypothetical protein
LLDLNKIYNLDCIEGMKQITDKYLELAIVEPPYGINAFNMSMSVIRIEKVMVILV